MSTKRKLSAKQLVDKFACNSQVYLFRRLFGESVMITEKLVEKYYDKFSFSWAAENLLSMEAWATYVYYLNEYLSRNSTADECMRARAKAWAKAYINDGR